MSEEECREIALYDLSNTDGVGQKHKTCSQREATEAFAGKADIQRVLDSLEVRLLGAGRARNVTRSSPPVCYVTRLGYGGVTAHCGGSQLVPALVTVALFARLPSH